MLTADLEFFKLSEFKHPERVDPDAAFWLNEVRREFGEPIILTDDARLPGDLPSGGSTSSLHYLGRAFDIRSRHWTRETYWRFAAAVFRVQARMPRGDRKVELELVDSPRDKHAHLGFYLSDGEPRLVLADE